MAIFRESKELLEIAEILIEKREEVRHVDVSQLLFLEEFELTPKADARCYSLHNHPIQFFTDKEFAIVVYRSNIDHFDQKQLAILLLHEMMHIPEVGYKLIDHDVKDFIEVLSLGIMWSCPGADVQNILGEDNGR